MRSSISSFTASCIWQAMTTRDPKGSPGPASCPPFSKPFSSRSGATGWTSVSSLFKSAPGLRVRVFDLQDLAALELSPRKMVQFLDFCSGCIVALGDLGQRLPLLDRVLDYGRLRCGRFLGFPLFARCHLGTLLRLLYGNLEDLSFRHLALALQA